MDLILQLRDSHVTAAGPSNLRAFKILILKNKLIQAFRKATDVPGKPVQSGFSSCYEHPAANQSKAGSVGAILTSVRARTDRVGLPNQSSPAFPSK
jgi:hypothetical protein